MGSHVKNMYHLPICVLFTLQLVKWMDWIEEERKNCSRSLNQLAICGIMRCYNLEDGAQGDTKDEYKIISDSTFADYFSPFAHRPANSDRNTDWAGAFGHQLMLNTY